MEEITVEFFNGLGKGTVTYGTVKPRTSIMMTSNTDCSESTRCVYGLVHLNQFCSSSEEKGSTV